MRNRAIEHMRLFKKRQVLKALFNRQDVMRSHHSSTYDQRSQSFVSELKSTQIEPILEKPARKVVIERPKPDKQLMKVFRRQLKLRSIFRPWLELTRARLERKTDFFRVRANSINRVAFEALRENVRITNGRRSKAKRIVHSRAVQLLGTAFVGFVENRKQRLLHRKLNKAAGLFFV